MRKGGGVGFVRRVGSMFWGEEDDGVWGWEDDVDCLVGGDGRTPCQRGAGGKGFWGAGRVGQGRGCGSCVFAFKV